LRVVDQAFAVVGVGGEVNKQAPIALHVVSIAAKSSSRSAPLMSI
jgi:hypothetical protein